MVRLSAMVFPEKNFDAGGVFPDVGEREVFPRRGQPARGEQVLRVDASGGDARRRDAGPGQFLPEGVDRALIGDHGGDGQAGHALVQHFGVHAIVENGFGFVERFFPARGHLGDGVAILGADFGNAVMAEFVLPVRKPDPDVGVTSSVRQKHAQRFAHPVGTARRFPVHAFRDADGLDGLKDRRAARATLRKANPALADINAHNGALFAEQRAAGRG